MAIRNLLLAAPLLTMLATSSLSAQAAPPPTAAEGAAPAPAPSTSDVPQMQLEAPEEHVVAPPPPVRSPEPAPVVSAPPPQYLQASDLHACAQPADAYRHDGFYLRVTTETQYLAFLGHGPDGSASVKGMATAGGMLAFGGTPLPGLVIAGTLGSEMLRGKFKGRPAQGQENASLTRAMLGVLVDWYPQPEDGWHVGAALGFAGITITDSAIPDAAGAAFSAKLFGGYDWWIGPQWSLGVAALFAATPSTALRVRDGDMSGYRFYTLSAGLAWTLALH